MTEDRPPQPKLYASITIVRGSDILLVQEGKPQNHGKWNLPGGHLEAGETILVGARRELVEETFVDAPPHALLGVYDAGESIRFVFLTDAGDQQHGAGDEILDCQYVAIDDVLTWGGDRLLGPISMHAILRDIQAGTRYPLDMFVEL